MISEQHAATVMVALSPLLLFIEVYLDRFSKHRKDRFFFFVKKRGLKAVQRLSWQDFERYCAGYFSSRGYRVQITGGGGADDGMDLLVSKNGKSAIVQCKRWKKPVGVQVIREMYGIMHANHHDQVFIIALTGYTKKAHAWALGKPIRLISAESL